MVIFFPIPYSKIPHWISMILSKILCSWFYFIDSYQLLDKRSLNTDNCKNDLINEIYFKIVLLENSYG